MKANTIFMILITIIAVGILAACTPVDVDLDNKADVAKKFASYAEFKSYLTESQDNGGGMYGSVGMMLRGGAQMAMMDTAVAESAKSGSDSYSTTNVQVEGVDEADILKNDGRYIYTISGKKIIIVDAYPAEDASILSEIEFDEAVREMFINEDKLIVFGIARSQRDYTFSTEVQSKMIAPDIMPQYYSSDTLIMVYDITDRSAPELVRTIEVEGDYQDSRMIGDYVYTIVNNQVRYYEEEYVMPMIRDGDVERTIAAEDIYYFPNPDSSYRFTNILSLNTQDDDEAVESETYLTSYSQNLFVSMNNIYFTFEKRPNPWVYQKAMIEEVYMEIMSDDFKSDMKKILNSGEDDNEMMNDAYRLLSDFTEDFTREEQQEFSEKMLDKMADFQNKMNKLYEKTVIHKVAIKNGKIDYKTYGEVPGTLLNQFSMDEFDGNFRAATTTGHVSRMGESSSANHIYILDEDLDMIGKVEDLAPGERIYSARFMGKRGYIVTFKKVDPLFVIDLSNPRDPTVLGKLKIPGYSDYLHPYDENHLIGIGKETVEAEEGDFAWYQGVKVSIFDVTDVSKPIELAKYEIGDRGTDSYALHEHKAFLFDREKNLLVLPIKLAEIDEEQYPNGVSDNTHGSFVWQGAYVFNIDLENGLELRGRVSHNEDDESYLKSGYYYSTPYAVQRSLYIGDNLYTVSSAMIKMNNLDTLEEVNSVELPYEQNNYPIYY
ncbi:beta-propeller domain-containing protein [archaeon]|nr:beta-propeller domain-containing protein [archaeon]MBL7057522.1 beta-propeller domain-containing protein [Candidatus Woesearchaeota archaeon]